MKTSIIVIISKHCVLTRPSSAPTPQCCWRQQPWRSSCRSVCHSPVSVISFVKAEVICRNACLHPHTMAGQEVSQKYACTGVFTDSHSTTRKKGWYHFKWLFKHCQDFWFMLLVNLLSFISFCFNEILFYFRWIQIRICFLLLLQQK